MGSTTAQFTITPVSGEHLVPDHLLHPPAPVSPDTWQHQQQLLGLCRSDQTRERHAALGERHGVYAVRYLLPWELMHLAPEPPPDDQPPPEGLPPGGAFLLLTRDYMPVGCWWHPQERRPLRPLERKPTRPKGLLGLEERSRLNASYAVRPVGVSVEDTYRELIHTLGEDTPGAPNTLYLFRDHTNPISPHENTRQGRKQAATLGERYRLRLATVASHAWEPVSPAAIG